MWQFQRTIAARFAGWALPRQKTNFEIKKRLTRAAHWQITRPVLASRHYILSRIAAKGAIAQLGERLLCKQEVVGSIPSGSTNFLHLYQLGIGRLAVTEWLCAIMANGVHLVSANQPMPCAWPK